MFSISVLENNRLIIESIVRWKSLFVDTLVDLVAKDSKLKDVRQRVYRLEKKGIIESKLFQHSKKLVFPSSEFLLLLGRQHAENLNQDLLRHQSLTALIGSSLLEFDYAQSFLLSEEIPKSNFQTNILDFPDALMTIDHRGVEFKVAVEVQAWKKINLMSDYKIIKLLKNHDHDYVFIFCADRLTFNSYKLRVRSLIENSSYKIFEERIKDNVVLFLLDCQTFHVRDLGECVIWRDGEESTFRKLLKR